MPKYEFTTLFDDAADVIVITIGAKRTDGGHVTDAQKDAAMNAAKSVLQMIGADVQANSSAIINPLELQEGEFALVSSSVDVSVKTYGEIENGNDEVEEDNPTVGQDETE